MDISLPYQLTLRPYQKPLWDHMVQPLPDLRACAIWPRRNGKDLICLNIIVAKAMQKPGLYLYIAPFQTQTRLAIWIGQTAGGNKFLDHIPASLTVRKLEQQMEVHFVNGSILKLIGADNFDSKMGAGAQGAVFTEYSLQRPEAWDYIRPMIRETHGFAIFNYTARGMNHGYAMHKMAQKSPKWFHEYLTCLDTGYPTQEDIQEEREAGMRESLIQQEYYNDFSASSEEVFIPLDIIAPTIKPTAQLQPEEYQHAPIIFGCDVAYAAKGDKATIACRQGRKLHFLRTYQGKDNMAFAAEISRFIKLLKPVAVNIDAGRGEGVISRLMQLGHDHVVFPVHFGGKVYEEGVGNRKAQMWLRMEDWFMDLNKPDMTDLDNHKYANDEVEELLIKELSTPFKEIDDKNVIKVESKKALKTRGESSPDLAEGLGLTFAEEIDPEDYPSPRQEQLGITPEMFRQLNQDNGTQDYDPLSYLSDLCMDNDYNLVS